MTVEPYSGLWLRWKMTPWTYNREAVGPGRLWSLLRVGADAVLPSELNLLINHVWFTNSVKVCISLILFILQESLTDPWPQILHDDVLLERLLQPLSVHPLPFSHIDFKPPLQRELRINTLKFMKDCTLLACLGKLAWMGNISSLYKGLCSMTLVCKVPLSQTRRLLVSQWTPTAGETKPLISTKIS